MAWNSVVADKRAIRDAAINEISSSLSADPIHDSWDVPVLANTSIALLLKQLSTGKLSAQSLVSTTINRYVGGCVDSSYKSFVKDPAADCSVHRAIKAHRDTNCLSEPLFQSALERARHLDEYFRTHGRLAGPLHGIPISIKDQFNVRGIDTTLGYVGRSFKPAQDTAVMVNILEKLGAVIITKTSIPQSIMYGETESPLWGLTTFPGRPELSPGGSSGGESALMAMSGAFGGWATDIGGSIRVPSHLCGIYGLKPSAGRFSYAGVANSHEGQSHVPSSIGPMSPHLSNLITMTKECLIAEPWMLDPNVVPIPWRQDLFEKAQNQPLTIGVILDDGIVRPHPEVQIAVQRAADLFERAGHKIIPWSTSEHLSCIEIQDQFYRADGGEDISAEIAVAGEPMIAHVEALINSSKPITVYEYWQLNRRKTLAQEAYNKRWNVPVDSKASDPAIVDVLISPVSPHTAVPHRSSRWTGYAKVWNFLDYTAMSFPFAKFGEPSVVKRGSLQISINASEKEREQYLRGYVTRNGTDEWIKSLYDPDKMQGLDIGIQIIGRRFQEEKVLGIAQLLESLMLKEL